MRNSKIVYDRQQTTRAETKSMGYGEKLCILESQCTDAPKYIENAI